MLVKAVSFKAIVYGAVGTRTSCYSRFAGYQRAVVTSYIYEREFLTRLLTRETLLICMCPSTLFPFER